MPCQEPESERKFFWIPPHITDPEAYIRHYGVDPSDESYCFLTYDKQRCSRQWLDRRGQLRRGC